MRTSSLRHPGEAQAHADALSSSKENRIVAYFRGAQASYGEAWIEQKSRLRRGSRLVQRATQAQGGAERKMGERIIAVGLNALLQPTGGFGICAELQLRDADKIHPSVAKDIARREAESLVNMAVGIGSATHKIFGETNIAVSVGQIVIKR
jgi:hypothetical protein